MLLADVSQRLSEEVQAERTTAMLTGIVAVFLVTELPQGVLGLAVGELDSSFSKRPKVQGRWEMHHGEIDQ